MKSAFKGFIAFLNSKIVLWVLIATSVVIGLKMYHCSSSKNERLETYNRQLKGDLTEKERILQSSHHDLGLMRSELVSREELNKRLSQEKEELDQNFEQFKKDHDLLIRSKDRTIASLKQQVEGGTTDVVVEDKDGCKDVSKCKISYSWSDPLLRFTLVDPNIFEKGDEKFTSSQMFKVFGEVWEQSDGSLQTRRLVIREVYKSSDGSYVDIDGAKAEIVESSFEYHNPPPMEEEWHWYRLFRIRPIIVGGVNMVPNLGETMLGGGIEFFNWHGLGLNTHIAFDFKDIKHAGTFVGVSYAPSFPKFKSNAGVGVSFGTPFYKPFQELSFKIDLVFYIFE